MGGSEGGGFLFDKPFLNSIRLELTKLQSNCNKQTGKSKSKVFIELGLQLNKQDVLEEYLFVNKQSPVKSKKELPSEASLCLGSFCSTCSIFVFLFSLSPGILFYCILPTSRHAKCTQIVLECNAECNNVANDGMPLLVLACMDSIENEKICLQFLENSADPNGVQPVGFPYGALDEQVFMRVGFSCHKAVLRKDAGSHPWLSPRG